MMSSWVLQTPSMKITSFGFSLAGINTLFYITNALPLYISFCHIALFNVSRELVEIANLTIVMNSTFKFFIYATLSRDFR